MQCNKNKNWRHLIPRAFCQWPSEWLFLLTWESLWPCGCNLCSIFASISSQLVSECEISWWCSCILSSTWISEMQLTTDSNKADLQHNLSIFFLLSASSALFSPCFMVKIFFIDVGRYEPLKSRLQLPDKASSKSLKQRERKRKRWKVSKFHSKTWWKNEEGAEATILSCLYRINAEEINFTLKRDVLRCILYLSRYRTNEIQQRPPVFLITWFSSFLLSIVVVFFLFRFIWYRVCVVSKTTKQKQINNWNGIVHRASNNLVQVTSRSCCFQIFPSAF